MRKRLLLMMLLLLPMVVSRAKTEINGIFYNLNSGNKTAQVTSGSNYTGSVTIPKTVTYSGVDYSVTSIGTGAFYGCSGLTDINIPNSVTSIGDYAFYDCSGLTDINIPNSVTSIGREAFYGTAWYNNQPNGLIYAGKVAYKYKGTMPLNTNIVLEEGTLGITASAFFGCSGLTAINIPNSVTSIGDDAFYGCSGLTDINIPNSVTSIGSDAFYGSAWYNNQPNGLIYAGKVAYKYKGTMPLNTNIVLEEGTLGIAANAFAWCSGLTDINIPNSVTSIGNGAFSGCSGLTDINIPNSVTNIGNYSFSYCSGLTSINIPNSVTSIGDNAFSYCSGLTAINIPNSVTSIGSSAFEDCSGLTSIVVETSNSNYDSRENCNAIIEIASNKLIAGCKNTVIPNSVTSIGDDAFEGCSGLTDINIPNSVTSIGSSAFSGCRGLTDINIPNSVTSIGSYAFQGTAWYNNQPNGLIYAGKVAYNYKGTMPLNTNIVLEEGTLGITASAFSWCSGLTDINIPNSVTSIGDFAFSGCSGLTDINIPNSVTSIGGFAFSGCSGLTSINIPNSVTSIGDFAFSGCSGLTSIVVETSNSKYDSRENCNAIIEIASNKLIAGCKNTVIPNSVTSIGNYAFDGCSGLTDINIPNSVTSIGHGAFLDCSGLTAINIPNSVTSIGSSAFGGCSGLTDINIPNSVTSIGDGAFSGCSGLTAINIPNSVTSIGNEAFSGCSGLTDINIPNSVTSIGSYAFYRCNGLTDVFCKAAQIPTTSSDAFYDSPISNVTLHVPASAVEAYSSTAPWSGFKEVVAIVEEKDYDWSIGAGGDFADINAAMADSRVKAGDVLQVLESDSAIPGEQHVTKAVTIRGNGYGTLNDGWINGALYIDADGVTVKSLYVSDYINLRNENAVIERCRAASIRGVADYDTDNATIRGCFVTGNVSGHSSNPSYYWNIHNNIILGPVAYLSKATLNHNAIVFSSDELVFLVNPLVYEVSDSKFANNIVFAPNKQASFSSDVLGSATQFEYNIHTNSSNPSGYSTNIYGYETIGKLFTCSGKAGTEEYYQTAAGSPAKGYANDGGDCGPWSGAFPYKLNGVDDSQGGGGGGDPTPGDDWQVEPNDLLALKNIHQALGGSNWTTKKWSFANNGHKAEDFPGVTFTEDGRVTAIDLQNNNLAGECFAIQSPQLSELTTLNLSRNKISGDLGKLVGQLGKLTDLDVSYNRLTKTDGVMAFVEAFASHINVRYQNRAYQTSSPTTAAFTDNVSTMDAQTVTIGRQMNLAVPSLYTYDYKYQQHRQNPPFKVYLAGSPTASMAQLVYNGNNYTNGYTYKYSGSGLYMLAQDQRVVLVDEWGSYATYSAFPVILHYEEGDADMTGATNVLDVQYTLNFILAPSVTTVFNWSAANTYTDGVINVQDIVQTVNIILGLPRQPNYASRAESDEAVCDGYVYARQGRIVLTAGKDVSAIDIDLEGVSTDEVALALNRRDFQMIGRNTEWGSRYMIFSPTGQTIPAGTETALLRMSGAGQPVSVACSDPQAQEVFVAVGNAPTGIAEVQGAAESETFYNLSGQRVDSPLKGIYLQRGRKVIVKK